MTLYEFKLLGEEEQPQGVWDLGEHLATRMTGAYKILLWQIGDLYIELFYNYVDSKIEKIRTFRTTELLTPYLDQIDITAIFK